MSSTYDYLTNTDFTLSLRGRAGLLNRLSVMTMCVVLVLVVVNVAMGKSTVHWSHPSIITALTMTIVINRLGYFKIAAAFGLLTLDAVLYIHASSEPYNTAVALHFVSTGFAGIIFFAREQKWCGIGFGILSLVLIYVATFGKMPALEYRQLTNTDIKSIFVINSAICAFICIYIFYYMMQVNSKVKHDLTVKKMEVNFWNQMLLKRNAELDRFIYSASHDLRAPLSSIAGLIDLCHLDQSETDKYLAMIKDRVGVMDRFITEIIDYSRNARLGVKNERIPLKQMIDDVVHLLLFSIPKPVELLNQVPAEMEIKTDRSRLQVVMSNLISNAVKYSDLTKTSPFIKIYAEITNNECQISVSDNGIGIHNQHHAKIFNMFYRATERSKGSGLGLFIVKETLDKIGARIEVVSEYGAGSEFKIWLPLPK